MAGEELTPVGAVDAGGGTAVAEAPPVEVETPAVGEIEAPETPTPEGEETPPEGAEPAEPGEGDEPAPDEFDSADGRKVDVKTREALAALKKVNPAAAKALAGDYHRTQSIIKDVGAQNLSEAVSKVRAMSATMESLGGEEGVTALTGEVEDYRREIAQFSEGDPALIQQLYEANPDGMATSTHNALTLLASKNLEQLDKALMPTLMSRLETAKLPQSVASLKALIMEGKGQEAYDLVQQIEKWLGDAKTFASKNVEMREAKNPEAEALARDRQALDQEKAQIQEHAIATDVNRINNTAMSRLIEPFFKDLKLPHEGRREFVSLLQSKVWAAQKADAAFQRQAKIIRAKGDNKRTAEFVSENFKSKLPDIFRTLRNTMYPNYAASTATKVKADGTPAPKPAVAKPNGAAPAAKAVAGMSPRPTREEVDWNKTDMLNYMTGKGVTLKNGKTINFDIHS